MNSDNGSVDFFFSFFTRVASFDGGIDHWKVPRDTPALGRAVAERRRCTGLWRWAGQQPLSPEKFVRNAPPLPPPLSERGYRSLRHDRITPQSFGGTVSSPLLNERSLLGPHPERSNSASKVV